MTYRRTWGYLFLVVSLITCLVAPSTVSPATLEDELIGYCIDETEEVQEATGGVASDSFLLGTNQYQTKP